MTHRLRLTAVLLALGVFPAAAAAQPIVPRCGDADMITDRLTTQYDEKPVSGGQSTNGIPMQVWVAEDRSTWTITFSPSADVICMVMAGEDWEVFEDMPVAAPGAEDAPDL